MRKYIKEISYRPFDFRFIFYEDRLVWRTVRKVMQHFLRGENLGLVFRRQQPEKLDLYIYCSNKLIIDGYIRSDNKGGESIAPLYLYPDNNGQQTLEETRERTPNLNQEIVNQIAENIGLTFTEEKEAAKNTFAPIDLLDYIYAVLHSPAYREKYREFLKIDFPRVPYPQDKKTFRELVKRGRSIREIHLLESPAVEKYITAYPVSGDNPVSKIQYQDEKVYINETQYFEGVPLLAWEFYIGGYQPAQKWLKDRKGRTLKFEEILHYQKIIVALSETDRLMKEIDQIERE